MLVAFFCSSADSKPAPNSRSEAIDDACMPGQLRLDTGAVSMGVLSMHHAHPGIGRLRPSPLALGQPPRPISLVHQAV